MGFKGLAQTVWFDANGLPVERPGFVQLTSAEFLGTATGFPAAIITNAYITTDQVSTHAERDALKPAGRCLW